MRRPGLLCLIFESTRSFPFRSGHFGSFVHLQHELHHERLAQILELLFRSLLVGNLKRLPCSCKKKVALPLYSDNCERSLSL